ncbi:hypothetical protein FHR84_002380 [Actinopolyspora biskrensis]|uniref:Uncharacterized protein n=1 Tax=Actinopolyspora biskrensis TaxID=1470178 RepID=A0A852Z635_9ACTN|nr:hypothetical protein [Actinopolyspora biskrensis]
MRLGTSEALSLPPPEVGRFGRERETRFHPVVSEDTPVIPGAGR